MKITIKPKQMLRSSLKLHTAKYNNGHSNRKKSEVSSQYKVPECKDAWQIQLSTLNTTQLTPMLRNLDLSPVPPVPPQKKPCEVAQNETWNWPAQVSPRNPNSPEFTPILPPALLSAA